MFKVKKGEKLIAVYRRHIFVLLLELFPPILFSIIVVAVASFLILMFFSGQTAMIVLILFIMTLFLHMLWLVIFISFADYYLDIWILTDRRVISIEQASLFARTTFEFELPKIQEVGVDVRGVIPTLFDYGNVRVRTASENPDFVFKQVGSPIDVKDEITKYMEQYEDKHMLTL